MQRFRPDVFLVERPAPVTIANTQTKTVTPPSKVDVLYPLEIRERWLEIYDATSRDVVTVIEVLSPHNKVGRGYKEFRDKRQKVLKSQASWLEIDLLRNGNRPKDVIGMSDYYVQLVRAKHRRPFETWFFDLRDDLPIVAVPLREEDGDVLLDLNEVKQMIFERARLALALDYDGEVPEPAVKPSDDNWIRKRIEQWKAQISIDNSKR